MITESYKERLQILSVIISEGGVGINYQKQGIFDELMDKVKTEDYGIYKQLMSQFNSLDENQREITINLFASRASIGEPVGNIIFKAKKALKVFNR